MNPRDRIPLPAFVRALPPAGFEARLLGIGARIGAPEMDLLGDYLGLLLAMNDLLNLTAIVLPDAAWERHILDALSLLPELASIPPGARVADLGSGGGVPALPLALTRRDLDFTLIESTQKKCAFLEDAASMLGLTNVRVVALRAETAARGELRASFAAVTARAVAPLERLVPLAAPLCAPGGRMLLIKGQRADDELHAAKAALVQTGARHIATRPTPTGRIVVLEKPPSK